MESTKRRTHDSLDNPREVVIAEVQHLSEAVAVTVIGSFGKKYKITMTGQAPSS